MATSETTDRTQQFRRSSEEWDAAWAARDFDRLLALYTDDAQWIDSDVPRPLIGKGELRAYFEAMLRAFPDIEITQQQLFSPLGGDEHEFASHWRLRGTFRAAFELPGITSTRMAATGDRVDITGTAVVTVDDDGRAKHVRQYSDSASFQRQIGMMPTEGSFGHRALQWLQGVGARRRMKRNLG